ncbi:GNAT family N-acetyltransferase [Streptomyces sp. TRM43335]|uniref:GNAT family N-acetyltransferase n=1 Tax=Streptomyces taklimakanensis TaxID=2569853 RepID=A0A6G2BH50_9ACTN|nr:GNAT family N-acetyltransferase [Streptomyces taklimakanensis]MTE21534.1 GNAT family N-acetyltransferase [Streptomyces taklimakanensis]
MSGTVTVTTWSLEQTSPHDLSPARIPDPESDVRIVRAEIPSPEFSRFLYTAVGGDVLWTDRLEWTYARWRTFLDRPDVETWVAYERGTPAGYIELEGRPEGVVEIVHFGLIPAFRGRGIGGHLLSYGTARAWDLAERRPEREPTRRVWLHTCSKDGPHALANYERRGFRLFRTEVTVEPAVPTPGPWPGAGPTANPAVASTVAPAGVRTVAR